MSLIQPRAPTPPQSAGKEGGEGQACDLCLSKQRFPEIHGERGNGSGISKQEMTFRHCCLTMQGTYVGWAWSIPGTGDPPTHACS